MMAATVARTPCAPNGVALIDAAVAKGSDAEPWPTPDLSVADTFAAPAPPFPVGVLGPWQGWAAASAAKVSAPVDYVAMALLSIAGATFANTRWGNPWSGWREPPIMNVGLVGLPSSGKSPALDLVFDPLRAAERELAKTWPEQHREWQKLALAAETRKKAWTKAVAAAVDAGDDPPELPASAEAPPEPKSPRLFTGDATVEAAAALARDHPKGLAVIRDELSGWIASMDRYGGEAGADRSFWIEAYGGRAKTIDRVKFQGQPLRIPHLSVAILGGIQPDRLASMLLAGDDDGLCARFNLVWPEPVPLARPSADGVRGDLVSAFVVLRRLEPAEMGGERSPKLVPFSPEAAELLHKFQRKNRTAQEAAAGLHLSWLGKLPGTVLRVATILEHLWWSAEPAKVVGGPWHIEAEAVREALRLVEGYLMPMAVRVLGESALPTSERDAAALARWLLAQRPMPERVNARALRHGAVIPTRDAGRYDAAIAELADAGWFRAAPRRAGDGPGRRSKDFAVNPKLADLIP